MARVDAKLELGGVTETVTVSAEAINNIVLESPSVCVGLDEQQLRDLPRNSRDMQSFLLLNPNVLGGSDDIQFLGGRTYGVSYVQDGQASTNAIFGTVGNSAPGLDAIAEVQVLSNSYSAEYGGLAGVVVTTKRGGNAYRGSAFYDYNADGLNALTYNQKQSGAVRGEPNSDTHAHRWGMSLGGPLVDGQDVLLRSTTRARTRRRSTAAAGPTSPPRPCATATSRAPTSRSADPLTGQPFPGNVIPANRIDPARPEHAELLLPAAEPGHALERHGRLPAVRAARPATGTGPTCASTTRPRARTRSSCARATSTATRTASSSRPATRSPTSASGTPSSTPPP